MQKTAHTLVHALVPSAIQGKLMSMSMSLQYLQVMQQLMLA